LIARAYQPDHQHLRILSFFTERQNMHVANE
jgi:hypothetical protein